MFWSRVGTQGTEFNTQRHSKWGIFEPSGFWKQRQKKCIFDTIPLYRSWLERIKSSAAKFKPAFAGWRWARDRRVYTHLRIITNHNSAELINVLTNQRRSDEFRARARWLHSLIRNNNINKSVYEQLNSSNSFSNYKGSFSEWSFDNVM